MSMSTRKKKHQTAEKPIPVVYSRHDGDMLKREGRGFSIPELKEAKLDIQTARKLGIRVDTRRRSLIEENVKSLKAILKPRTHAKRKTKKAQSSERERE